METAAQTRPHVSLSLVSASFYWQRAATVTKRGTNQWCKTKHAEVELAMLILPLEVADIIDLLPF